ncbi:ABC transporter substrate-binding protein [Lachnospiraceae bacterium 54-53]
MKSKRFLVLLAVAMAALTVMSGCSTSDKSAEAPSSGTTAEHSSSESESSSDETSKEELAFYDKTMYIGQSSWIGYAPLFIAVEKGFFEDHGSDIQIHTIQSAADRRAALISGEIQAMSSTVDTHVMSNAAGVDLVQILALDTSSGGDGLIAKKEFNSLEDLKGKTVALDTSGGASYFWFYYLLQEEGLKFSDFNVQSMGAGDAGTAFVAGQVDAAVTWQPWLTNATNTDFGKVLISSSETPGIIMDTIGVTQDFIDKYPGTVKALVAGWYDALAFIESDPDEANRIMAEAMGQDVESFAETLPEVTFYDEAMNLEYFGTADKPGDIFTIAQSASDLWFAEKLIDSQPDLTKYISGEFLSTK